MDWRSVNFDWNRARAFLVAAEEGSYSAAARALGLAQPTVGRQVAALEDELGVVLFERTGHALQLSPTGLSLLEHVRAMGQAATAVSLAATGRAEALEGSVCISASEVVAAFVLPPFVQRLRQLHPGIELELVSTNSASDLGRREADLAVRSFRPTQPDLVARKVRDGRARLYAAPSLLERLGHPATPEALSRADFIGFDRGPALMQGLNALGLSLTPASFPVLSHSQLVQWELVKQGVGVGIITEDIGDAEPRVRRALPELPPFPVPTWLTAHREVRTSRRVRVVYDLLADFLAGGAAPNAE